MTDPTTIPASSSGGSTTLPPPSPSRETPSPTQLAPTLSTSTSESHPKTAPASPERVQVISQQQQKMMTMTTPVVPLKPTSPAQQQAPETSQLDSVVLGLQQLERQQAEQEQKRQAQEAVQQPILHDSEDDSTAPSSTQNSNATEEVEPQESSIGRFINNTRKRLSSRDLKASDKQSNTMGEPVTHAVYGNVPEISDAMQFEGAGQNLLICGYLHKFGRNGKWQRRFFETDGENLTYYKTSARAKLLATLDLVKVGDICVDSEDPDGCTFIIQVADRPYRLRADSQSSCRDWVITLNRVKEARMHIGRVQLVRSVCSNSQQEEASARVVLEANRARTKHVDGEDIHSWEDIVAAENAAAQQQEMDMAAVHATRLGTAGKRIQEAAAARWQKRQTSMQRLAGRVLIWARSVKMMKMSKCTEVEDQVVLDHHIHPPNRPDSYGQAGNRSSDSSVASQNVLPTVATTTRGSRDEDEEQETRELS